MSFLSVPVSITALFSKGRKIGEISVDVIMSESTNDTLTITKQPVQEGTTVTDHAYKEPTTLSMDIYFRDNLTKSLSKVYQDLLDLQESRDPVTVITPKRIYESMLISSISMTTDKATENTLHINISFQELIVVSVATTSVPRSKQRNAGATGQTTNAGRKSALATLFGGVGG